MRGKEARCARDAARVGGAAARALVIAGCGLGALFAATDPGAREAPHPAIGREVSVPVHLRDGAEHSMPVTELIAHGARLFSASWTSQEGGGRPLTKGTGRPVTDPMRPLRGERAFNRVSGPDANSCSGCHNAPHGIAGGGGDFVTNVFVLGQRFDFVTFDPQDTLPTAGTFDETGRAATLRDLANLRATTGMFGSGYLEMIARQMTEELQGIRDSIRRGETKDLVAKGVSFGRLTLGSSGLWDTSEVRGLGRLSLLSTDSHHPPSLAIRPWHQASHVISLREFTNTAYNQHHGIQSTERFGRGTDPDGDGHVDELTRADITAVTLYQATLQVPGRVIPRHPLIERAVLEGERLFERAGCASCHVPRLGLDDSGWIYREPSPFNPPGNLRSGEAAEVSVDLTSETLPQPRLRPDASGTVWVEAYTDFKIHDLCPEGETSEPLDMNQSQWSEKFREGNCRFLTKRLWGAANLPPFLHDGLCTTLREAILAHDGEARASRMAFEALESGERDALVEFLKSLQVLPPGTRALIVDEEYRPRAWPPREIARQREGDRQP